MQRKQLIRLCLAAIVFGVVCFVFFEDITPSRPVEQREAAGVRPESPDAARADGFVPSEPGSPTREIVKPASASETADCFFVGRLVGVPLALIPGDLYLVARRQALPFDVLPIADDGTFRFEGRSDELKSLELHTTSEPLPTTGGQPDAWPCTEGSLQLELTEDLVGFCLLDDDQRIITEEPFAVFWRFGQEASPVERKGGIAIAATPGGLPDAIHVIRGTGDSVPTEISDWSWVKEGLLGIRIDAIPFPQGNLRVIGGAADPPVAGITPQLVLEDRTGPPFSRTGQQHVLHDDLLVRGLPANLYDVYWAWNGAIGRLIASDVRILDGEEATIVSVRPVIVALKGEVVGWEALPPGHRPAWIEIDGSRARVEDGRFVATAGLPIEPAHYQVVMPDRGRVGRSGVNITYDEPREVLLVSVLSENLFSKTLRCDPVSEGHLQLQYYGAGTTTPELAGLTPPPIRLEQARPGEMTWSCAGDPWSFRGWLVEFSPPHTMIREWVVAEGREPEYVAAPGRWATVQLAASEEAEPTGEGREDSGPVWDLYLGRGPMQGWAPPLVFAGRFTREALNTGQQLWLPSSANRLALAVRGRIVAEAPIRDGETVLQLRM